MVNALKSLGCNVKMVRDVDDIVNAERLLFPGVGAYGQGMDALKSKGFVEPLTEYLHSGRPFLGICLGLQLLFEGSEENGGVEGLGILPGRVELFDKSHGLPVPHIGWNTLEVEKPSKLLRNTEDRRVYFVHSFRASLNEANKEFVLSTTNYGDDFISSIRKGEIYATQFHPEKSGAVGLQLLQDFVSPSDEESLPLATTSPRGLAKRVIACLDVRANDRGDLVVTKGDQYDVRESSNEDGSSGEVRNLGKPVELAERYFLEGADEVTFLNITGFRDFPLNDVPMLEVLQSASENIFVPLTVGGGIREFTDENGRSYTALEVASQYFRAGADKVSIGSDAVTAAEEYYSSGKQTTGKTAIEQISVHYGAQAVVISIDPRRVYVADPSECPHETVKTSKVGPNGEAYVWWQCTVKGGREGRPIGAVELSRAVEALGAGEILLNCIDNDGVGQGFDLELVEAVSSAVTIPVIASSGAGKPEHFSDVFQNTGASAALAAGIFHRKEVSILDVKHNMFASGVPARF